MLGKYAHHMIIILTKQYLRFHKKSLPFDSDKIVPM